MTEPRRMLTNAGRESSRHPTAGPNATVGARVRTGAGAGTGTSVPVPAPAATTSRPPPRGAFPLVRAARMGFVTAVLWGFGRRVYGLGFRV
jgi:hypothetical protein